MIQLHRYKRQCQSKFYTEGEVRKKANTLFRQALQSTTKLNRYIWFQTGKLNVLH